MYIYDIRAKRYAVKIRTFSKEKAAFQSGMYDRYDRFFSIEFFIGVRHDLAQPGVRIILPRRIFIRRSEEHTSELQSQR